MISFQFFIQNILFYISGEFLRTSDPWSRGNLWGTSRKFTKGRHSGNQIRLRTFAGAASRLQGCMGGEFVVDYHVHDIYAIISEGIIAPLYELTMQNDRLMSLYNY